MNIPDALVVVTNENKAPAMALAEQLEAWCQQQGWGFQQLGEAPDGEFPWKHPLGMSLGGDGTLLRAARYLVPYGMPLLGVNLGTLGFLSPLNADDVWTALEAVGQGKFQVERRMCLETTLPVHAHVAINEISVQHSRTEVITEVELYHGSEFIASYPGDGVLLSTPTGSTAYSLAAGGPVLAPDLRAMLVTPLNPHKLGLRPLVLPAECALSVKVNGRAAVVVDGRVLEVIKAGTCFEVRVSSSEVHLVRLDNAPDFFTLLEEKLHWQRRSPQKAWEE